MGIAESKDDWNGEAKNGTKKEEEESLEQLTKQLDEAMLKEKERKEAVELLEEEEEGDETLIESYHEDAPNARCRNFTCVLDLEPTKAEAKRKALGLSAKVDSMLNKYAQEEGLEVSEIEKSLLALHAGGKAVEMKDMMDESGTKEVSSCVARRNV